MKDSSQPFGRGPALAAIRASSARMWFVSALGKGGGQAVQLLAMMVLARLLVPEDFGLVAMAMVIIGVADIFQEFGLSAATVRAPELDSAQVSAMFILNLLLGLVMTVLTVLLAPLAISIYHEPRAVAVIQCLACTFLINGLGSQHQALLRRQLKFGVLASINLVVVVVSQLSAVALAFQGYGYWSLVIALLVAATLRTVMFWIMSPWSPVRPSFDRRTRGMIRFGGYLALFGLIGFVANHAHSIIIGQRFGAADVGFYSRAFILLGLFLGYVMAPLATVVPAALARALNDAQEYKALYFHYVAMMLSMAAPLGLLVALTAKDIIVIVLGEQWQSSILILQILALSVIPRTLSATSGWLYQSNGDSRSMMLWGLAGWGTLLLLLVAGARSGIVGVAVAYSGGMFLLFYPCMWFAFRKNRLRFSELLAVAAPITGAALVALLPTIPLWWFLKESLPVLRLFLLSAIYMSCYIGLLFKVFGQGQIIGDMFKQLLPGAIEKPVMKSTAIQRLVD